MENKLIGTNLELFGSSLEHQIKLASAECEPAWTNTDISNIGLHIWRVENFKLVSILSDIGQFFEGDSYIILKIYLNNNNILKYNIHFWLGKFTTQDEMGTAAYKTVELDNYLGGIAVQYREIQNKESDLFRSYFPLPILYLRGGVDSGFHKVSELTYDNYIPILYKLNQKHVMQIPLMLNSITETDIFILDTGLIVYIYKGKKISPVQLYLAKCSAETIKNNRKGSFIKFIDDDESYILFINYVTKYTNSATSLQSLTRINENEGIITCTNISPISLDSFDTNDAFVFKTYHTTYVWVGKKSNYSESLNAWKVAFKTTNINDSILLVQEGKEDDVFLMNF